MHSLLQWWRSRALNSPSPDVRLRAIERLAASDDNHAAALLLEALEDPDTELRASAATALAELGDTRAVGPLIELVLREHELGVDHRITDALARFDRNRIVPRLVKALDDPDVSARQAAASVLRRVGWSALDDAERARVAIVLDDWATAAELGPAAVKPLEAALLEGTRHAQQLAAETLGQIGTIESFRALLAILENIELDDATRSVAASVLRSYCWEWINDTHLAMIAIVLDDWSGVVKLGPPAVAPLAQALRAGTPHAGESAAQALGEIATDEAIDALATALADNKQDARVREAAARSLGHAAHERARHALVFALDDEGWLIRVAAAKTLEAMNWHPAEGRQRALFAIARKDWSEAVALGSEAVKPLVHALRYQAISTDAARALIRVDPVGADALVAVLKDRDQDVAVREVAAIALADHHDPRAVEPLMAMLDDPDVAVRLSAVWMLERLDWKPANDAQRAVAAIAHGDWDQLPNIGAPAVELLLRLAGDLMAPHETVTALESILKTTPGRVSINHLRELAALENLSCAPAAGHGDRKEPVVSRSHTVDCAKVRALAKAELIRRGIMF